MDMKKTRLVLIRHGQSEWNKKNLFTGWVDVPLSSEGIREAVDAGKEVAHIPFDVIFTSSLVRAQLTAFLVMSQHDEGKTPIVQGGDKHSKIFSKKAQQDSIPVFCAKELNERMYGELQGKNKDETREEFGKEQVHIWRRSFDIPPPQGESLKMTSERTLPYFKDKIFPYLKRGQNVLVAAHGNSLRAIVKEIEQISDEEIPNLEIPTGKPLYYEYAKGKLIKDVSS